MKRSSQSISRRHKLTKDPPPPNMALASLFSCDLVTASEEHVLFLRQLHQLGITVLEPDAVSLSRYLDYWLPLVNEHQNDMVPWIPPPDIAWLWHCHRLAPEVYESYVIQRFGRLVDTNSRFRFQLECDVDAEPAMLLPRERWNEMYPNIPFNYVVGSSLHHDSEGVDELLARARNLNGFDLLASAKCQATFLWQVSGPRFHEQEFLQEAVVKYHNFLQLKTKDRLPLVPTYQIDLMWHTHILAGLEDYKKDCLRIRGEAFHHDDSLNDRAPGSKLNMAFAETARLWRAAYGEEYFVQGGMYRGKPFPAYYDVEKWDPITEHHHSSEIIDDTTVKMIQAVQGASSMGVTASSRPWSNPRTQGAFIRGQPRSTVKNVNNNPIMEHYVFGKGTMGNGYYSFATRDAYKIIYKRLQLRIRYATSQVEWYDCNNCLCVGCIQPTPGQVRKREKLITDLEKLKFMLAFVELKYRAIGPDAVISPDQVKRNVKSRDESIDSSSILLPYAPLDLWSAASCGGGANGCGAGCGGGACG